MPLDYFDKCTIITAFCPNYFDFDGLIDPNLLKVAVKFSYLIVVFV